MRMTKPHQNDSVVKWNDVSLFVDASCFARSFLAFNDLRAKTPPTMPTISKTIPRTSAKASTDVSTKTKR